MQFVQATAGTYAGDMAGTGALVKTGTGTVTLSGNNTFSGTTTISAGRLSVNGVLGTTAVAIGSGAELGGAGSIGGLNFTDDYLPSSSFVTVTAVPEPSTLLLAALGTNLAAYAAVSRTGFSLSYFSLSRSS
ncbi:MAG: autotransporter-associated beta strand repeat-containing protein [Planctomycetia bacterium]|nr:autotransporter-associated beta strand repeat-containing protein [Planctomycetia bacterium]